MPGAWEIQDNQSVLCAVLSVDTTTVAWALGIKNLVIPPNGRMIALAGMPFDMSRNSACQACLESGATWLFFLDSDVVPPPDAVLRLMAHQQSIVSGVYYRRSPPLGFPVMMRRDPGNGMLGWVTSYPMNAVIEVDVVGSGCQLIHRSVLERMAKQPSRPGKTWFDWRVDLQGQGLYPPQECLSEDYVFCLNAQRSGYKILVDTSIQCRHVGLAESHLNMQTLQPEFVPCHAAV